MKSSLLIKVLIRTRIYALSAKFSTKASNYDQESPLSGIRILDLTRIVAGPFCTMTLGDLGAEVIKIEKPGAGDEARKWGPPYVNNTKESCYFVAVNRNKKSLCVDMTHPKGNKIIIDLAKQSDVLIENYIPGKLDKYKLGYNDLKDVVPRLIYCSISAYGSKGPYAKKPGYDVIAASMGGFLNITGPEDGAPVKAGVAVTDLLTGLYAHGAIIAALYKRLHTNRGQKIDCNLLSTQVAALINIGSNYINAGKEARRLGTAHESIVPYEAFRTKDGYLTLGAGSDNQFVDLCNRLNIPDIAKDEKFLTNALRTKNRIEIISLVKSIMVKKSNKEWTEIFTGASFPNGPVNNLKEVFNDPHIKAIDLVKTLKHPQTGDIKTVGPPVEYSEGGNYPRLPPPLLGEHTKEILSSILKYDDNKIQHLIDLNIV